MIIQLIIESVKKNIRKVVETMVIIYATLIIKGKKTFADVPERLKNEVKQILIDLDCVDLAQ